MPEHEHRKAPRLGPELLEQLERSLVLVGVGELLGRRELAVECPAGEQREFRRRRSGRAEKRRVFREIRCRGHWSQHLRARAAVDSR